MDISAIKGKGKGYKGKRANTNEKDQEKATEDTKEKDKERATGDTKQKDKERATEDTKEKKKDTKDMAKVQLDKAILSA